MTTALILGRNNGVGLDRDAALLGRELEQAGVSAKCPGLKSIRDLLSREFRTDAAFHLERAAPWWKRKARTHVLIPNQERFPERLLGRLKMIDRVWCKSRHAVEIFAKHHPRVRFIGFTSEDRMLERTEPDYGRFFHLAGRSTLKNTELLLELWRRHPEWPVLALVQHPENAPATVPGNVNLVSRYLPDAELKEMQNTSGIHLCPSLSEGWGHYIVEAMSCRAVTLTTDGPPMNELVESGRGILVPVGCSKPRHLGENFHVDPGALERAIQDLIDAPESTKREMGEAGRAWFLANQAGFSRRFAEGLREMEVPG